MANNKKKETALAPTKQVDMMQCAPESIKPLTALDVVNQVELIKEIQTKVMEKDVHYGLIPGCGTKPTLLKAGAEKLCLTFRLASEVAEQTDLSTPDMIRYRVKINLLRIADGQFVGSGIGECSSAEEKYQWRKAYKEEYEATPTDKRKVKQTQYGPKYMVKTNPFDNANTILKMAKKRALVDAVLTATAASDLFTQDIEEMEHINGQEAEPAKPKPPEIKLPEFPKKTEPKTESKPEPDADCISPQTVRNIQHALKRDGIDDAELLIDMGVGSLAMIPKSAVEAVRVWIKNKAVEKKPQEVKHEQPVS